MFAFVFVYMFVFAPYSFLFYVRFIVLNDHDKLFTETGRRQCKRNGAAKKKNKKRTKKKQKNHVFEEEEEHAKRERGTRQKHRPFLVRCGPDFFRKIISSHWFWFSATK